MLKNDLLCLENTKKMIRHEHDHLTYFLPLTVSHLLHVKQVLDM